MTTLREAATHALEALESAVEYDYHGTPLTETHAGFNDAATALRTALAEKALHIDTIRMALEAGFGCDTDGHIFTDNHDGVCDEYLERFASLVAAAERERFADECIDIVARWGGSVEIEAAIRARSNT